MIDRVPALIAALWWGSLSTIGFLVVPMLFAHLATPAIAGNMAAKLFSAQTGLALVCGLLLLTLSRPGGMSKLHPWAQSALGGILAGMLLALLLEFAVAPHIVARDNLKLWHSLGSAFYLAQWLCAGWVLWRLTDKSNRHN